MLNLLFSLFFDINLFIALISVVKAQVAEPFQGSNEICNPSEKVLLPNSADSTGQTYLQCLGNPKTPNYGLWHSIRCPAGSKFFYEQQTCLYLSSSQSQGSHTPALGRRTVFAQQFSTNPQIFGAYQYPDYNGGYYEPFISEDLRSTGSFSPVPDLFAATQVFPGESCADGETCAGNSFCNPDTSVCTCEDGTQDVRGECLQTLSIANPGEPCYASWQCTGDSECSGGICKCPQGMVDIDGQCVRRVIMKQAYFGDPCNRGEKCHGGSKCNAAVGLCICPLGTEPAGKICRPTEHQPTSKVTQPTGPKMVLVALPGMDCRSKEICTGGSRCEGGICKCPQGLIPNKHSCVKATSEDLYNPKTTSKLYPKIGFDPFNPPFTQPVVSAITTTPAPFVPAPLIVPVDTPNSATYISPGHTQNQIVPGYGIRGIPQDNINPSPEQRGVELIHTGGYWKKVVIPQVVSTSPKPPNYTRVGVPSFINMLSKLGEVSSASQPAPVYGEAPVTAFPKATTAIEMQIPANLIPAPKEIKVDPGSESVWSGYAVDARGSAWENSGGNFPFPSDRIVSTTHVSAPSWKLPPNIVVVPGRMENTSFSAKGGAKTYTGSLGAESTVLGSPSDIFTTRSAQRAVQPQLTIQVKQRSKVIGETCTSNGMCAVGSYCKMIQQSIGLCTCLTTHVAVGNKCYEIIYPGQSGCQYSEQCTAVFESAQCNGGQCECPSGMIASGQTCRLPSTRPDTMSSMSIFFPTSNTQSLFTSGTWLQPTPAAEVSAPPGGSCSGGQRCSGGSWCSGGWCTCPDSGMVVQNGRCVSSLPSQPARRTSAMPGHSCGPDSDCEGNSICIKNVCQCGPGFQLISGQCIEARLLSSSPGKSCVNGNGCTGGSYCDGKVCVCPPGSQLSGVFCKKVAARPSHLESCSSGQSCEGNLVCNGSICQCPPGWIFSGTTCVQDKRVKVSPGAACIQSEQCSGGSDCINGICLCPANTQLGSAGNCVRSSTVTQTTSSGRRVTPGGSCSHGDICIGGAFCANGVCTCPAGSQNIGNQCQAIDTTWGREVTGSSPGDPCQGNEDCNGGSYCRLGFCVCPVGTESYGMGCVRPNEKPLSAIPSSSGINRENIFGGLPSGASLEILPGGPCTELNTCLGGSICSMGECKCPVGTKEQEGVCLPTGKLALPGNVCGPHQVCIGGSHCVSGFCVCPPGFKIERNACRRELIRKKGPDYGPQKISCTGDIDCSGGAYCNAGYCKCLPGMGLANGLCSKAALRTAKPGESCSNGKRCTGNSYCDHVDAMCKCDRGTFQDGVICRKLAKTPTQRIVIKGGSSRNGTRSKAEVNRAGPCPGAQGCQLPDCFCSPTGMDIPGGLKAEEIPQFVVLTFDDAINDKTVHVHKRLFDGRFKNKNGCPIKGTFFVSHEWTNYDDVQWLSHNDHELASNSMTHVNLAGKSSKGWSDEMDGVRRAMNKFANVNPNDVFGMRAPQLSLGGDEMFHMMKSSGFLYDNSATANAGQDSPPFWPQTLDYAMSWECKSRWCPKGSHPGIWEIPINQFFGYFLEDINGFKRGSMLGAAMSEDETLESTLKLLRKNFNRAYATNKAPFVLTLDAGFFNGIGESFPALENFVEEALSMPDVYVVTMQQLIQWLRTPVPLSDIHTFAPFACSSPTSQTPTPCKVSNKCLYKTPKLNTGEHLFKTCNSCPKRYPWLGNPEGD